MKCQHRYIVPVFLSSILFSISPVHAANYRFISASEMPSGSDINTMMRLNQSYDFRPVAKITLPNGVIKYKFNQYYQSVPVWGVSLAATRTKAGELSNLSGNYLTNIENDLALTSARISKQEALNIAINSKNLSTQTKSLITNEEVNLFIIQDNQQKARLVYQISFMINDKAPSRPHFMIDANTGDIIKQWEGLTTSKNAIGPGGNTKTGQYNYGTDYGYLIVSDTCQMISPNVDTYDLKNLTSGEVIHQFDCSGNPPINTYKLTNGAFSPINDAHYFGNVVFNMYQAWFNTSPLTMKLKLRVHYGVNYENAFWDGRQMTFGDGLSRFYPLVSMDVVGHEISHGFTQQNSNLIYSGQSGGINEAFSDIAGEATEYFNNENRPGPRNDWLVGATIVKTGVALRYFADPTRDGRSIGNAKDYVDGLNVHYSSGVFNKAFYTLANKANWNTEKAFRAFVLANQVYWNQSSNFVNAACGVKKAAQDLAYNTQDVIDAFNVVGVDASCGVTPPPTGDGELKNGVPVVNLSGPVDDKKYWYVNIPTGTASLVVKMSGGTGNANMYVLYGQKPSSNLFSCGPKRADNNETCTFTPPIRGKYYVLVQGFANYSGVTLVANYQ